VELIRCEFLSDDSISLFVNHFEYPEFSETIWNEIVRRLKKEEDRTTKVHRFCSSSQSVSNSVLRLDSVIISSIPTIFNEFGNKTYRLLYRGSRDGFDSVHFHANVDGHSNTVTIIETTKGFIFGGFMKCVWDSSNSWKADDSQKSFLFTMKNPHSIPARKLSLTPNMKQYAMYCWTADPLIWFGNGGAIGISAGCTTNNQSHNTGFGHSNGSYENDTGLNGPTFFTGESNYTVKDLEIFELID
jgi:hypothetical protein